MLSQSSRLWFITYFWLLFSRIFDKWVFFFKKAQMSPQFWNDPCTKRHCVSSTFTLSTAVMNRIIKGTFWAGKCILNWQNIWHYLRFRFIGSVPSRKCLSLIFSQSGPFVTEVHEGLTVMSQLSQTPATWWDVGQGFFVRKGKEVSVTM